MLDVVFCFLEFVVVGVRGRCLSLFFKIEIVFGGS